MLLHIVCLLVLYSGPTFGELQCPEIPGDQFGVCVDNCTVTVPCLNQGELCCNNGCGYECVPAVDIPSCNDIKCEEKHHCELKNFACVTEPCYPIPTCVPDDIPSCNDIKCEKKHHCELKEIECVTVPCYPVPTCVPDEKRHVCPVGQPVGGYCGRGGSPCPPGYLCNIAPDDSYAVCCPSCPGMPQVLPLSKCGDKEGRKEHKEHRCRKDAHCAKLPGAKKWGCCPNLKG